MTLSIATVETLSPDQASLDAAKKLLKPAKWSGFGQSAPFIWSQCQGSGATPYYTVVDLDNHGYKCTCPSRKFPCKHALALMLLFINDNSPFVNAEIPDWVNDWQGRRRKTTATEVSKSPTSHSNKSLGDLTADETPVPQDPKKAESAQKRAEKLAEKNQALIVSAIADWQGWANDQLRLGLSAFMANSASICRQIAARMSDAKMTAFASRLDELPATLANLDKAVQADWLLAELGKLFILTQAHLNGDPDAKAFLTTSEQKEKIVENQNTLHGVGVWQVIGEQTMTKQDGLIAHTLWLVNLADNDLPKFAQLLDFHHHKPFKKSRSAVGNIMVGDLYFYPSRLPLRAFFVQQETLSLPQIYQKNKALELICDKQTYRYPTPTPLYQAYADDLAKQAWLEKSPHFLQAGRAVQDADGTFWYTDGTHHYPLANQKLDAVIVGSELWGGFALYDGTVCELVSVITEQGIMVC